MSGVTFPILPLEAFHRLAYFASTQGVGNEKKTPPPSIPLWQCPWRGWLDFVVVPTAPHKHAVRRASVCVCTHMSVLVCVYMISRKWIQINENGAQARKEDADAHKHNDQRDGPVGSFLPISLPSVDWNRCRCPVDRGWGWVSRQQAEKKLHIYTHTHYTTYPIKQM